MVFIRIGNEIRYRNESCSIHYSMSELEPTEGRKRAMRLRLDTDADYFGQDKSNIVAQCQRWGLI